MKRILVPTDFSAPSLQALRYGIELTSTLEGELLLLHVIEGEPTRYHAVGELPASLSYYIDLTVTIVGHQAPQEVIRQDLCEEAHWKLAALLPAGASERFHTLVTVGRAADEIVRVAKEQSADLIVMGGRASWGWRRLLRRPVADKVIRKAHIPVIAMDATDRSSRRMPSGGSVPNWLADEGRTASEGTAQRSSTVTAGSARKPSPRPHDHPGLRNRVRNV
jgi:nucleotide-binding universal stress UspA family protein